MNLWYEIYLIYINIRDQSIQGANIELFLPYMRDIQ